MSLKKSNQSDSDTAGNAIRSIREPVLHAAALLRSGQRQRKADVLTKSGKMTVLTANPKSYYYFWGSPIAKTSEDK